MHKYLLFKFYLKRKVFILKVNYFPTNLLGIFKMIKAELPLRVAEEIRTDKKRMTWSPSRFYLFKSMQWPPGSTTSICCWFTHSRVGLRDMKKHGSILHWIKKWNKSLQTCFYWPNCTWILVMTMKIDIHPTMWTLSPCCQISFFAPIFQLVKSQWKAK